MCKFPNAEGQKDLLHTLMSQSPHLKLDRCLEKGINESRVPDQRWDGAVPRTPAPISCPAYVLKVDDPRFCLLSS